MIYTITLICGLAASMTANFYLKSKNKALKHSIDILNDENETLTDELTLIERKVADQGMANYLLEGINNKDISRKQFKKETGKHAIWGGKETKNFRNWYMKKLRK